MEADFIRLALFISGVVVVLGIYFWSRKRSISANDNMDLIRRAYSNEGESGSDQNSPEPKPRQKPLWQEGSDEPPLSPIDQALQSGGADRVEVVTEQVQQTQPEQEKVQVEFVPLESPLQDEPMQLDLPTTDGTEKDGSFYDLLTQQSESEPEDELNSSSDSPLDSNELETLDSEWSMSDEPESEQAEVEPIEAPVETVETAEPNVEAAEFEQSDDELPEGGETVTETEVEARVSDQGLVAETDSETETETETETGADSEPEPPLLVNEVDEVSEPLHDDVLNHILQKITHGEQQMALAIEGQDRTEPSSTSIGAVSTSDEHKKEPWLDLSEIQSLRAGSVAKIDDQVERNIEPDSDQPIDPETQPAFDMLPESELEFESEDERPPESDSDHSPEPVAESEPDPAPEPEPQAEVLAQDVEETEEPFAGEQLTIQFDAYDPPIFERPDADLPGMLIQINLVSRNGEIDGYEILDLVNELDLRAGEKKIFHRVEKDGNRVVFSLVNMVEPGSFPFEGMESFSTPGLTLFVLLPCPIDSMVAYDDMLSTARQIAAAVGAQLQDETHSILSKQNIEHTRSLIQEHRRQVQLALVKRGKKRRR